MANCRGLSFIVLLSGLLSPLTAQMSLSVTSTSSRAPLGTAVNWRAQVVAPEAPDIEPTSGGTIWYRYRVRRFGSDFQIIRDFGPNTDLSWASEHEGTYEMEVTARDVYTGAQDTRTVLFETTALATDSPVVTPTAHPLVFLYSAPACAAGSRVRVEYQAPGGDVQVTPYKPCRRGLTVNFQLGGLQPGTAYQVHHVTDTGSAFHSGPVLNLMSGALPIQFAPYNVVKAPANLSSGVLLQSTLFEPTVATDLNGNVIWYYPGDISSLTRPEGDGRFLGIYQDLNADIAHQIVREFDIAGNTIQETNAARLNEQLAAMNKRQISGFHHEARRLPDGNLMVLADVEQILTDVQGPGPVDVLGDMILVLDRDMQVVWTWDAFDYLDPSRRAVLNEVCQRPNLVGGCPPFYLADRATDWLHGNSLQLTPDGNILYSARHQDWVIKIDYRNGAGSGNILWRLGKDGDFTFNSTDPYPWFSHQHDPNIEATDPLLLAVFDNGNTRHAADGSNSRGQVIKLDEQNRVATLVLNADLGAFSLALGSAHLLPNGNYHFDAGFINLPTGIWSRSIETDLSGSIVYLLEASTPVYRSFRMQSLYNP